MDKKYLSKIIATDNDGLQMISACCSGAEIKVNDIKYLPKSKVFLLSLKRSKVETEDDDKKVISICKFEFVDQVKSKNIKQADLDQKLELIGMDYLKNNENYEINLIFTNNAYITLSTEIIEVTLDDQSKVD
ncbi:MAG: hypothetical protein ABS16_03760 [Pelagibacteraceae bacterium BACL20 MAG-120920-bin64]|jgi:hypothetical protein|uniref:DUF2948 family protein n=1 Tax=Candidatus Pelagibacter sp. TaxID=2024849 RepID=UPI000714D185|nr:MAG: hypothetical protein ABS16_03760 [Pelagibacteraceae bacterium BACL20 MAG-120920-bin64]